MYALIISLVIIIGLNCIPLLTKVTFPKFEKKIVKTMALAYITFLIIGTFELLGYSLKGFHTLSIISWIIIASTILFFAIFKNTRRKLLITFVSTPLLVITGLTLIFRQLEYEQILDEIIKISVRKGGFLACGETINISKTKFCFFDKKIIYIDDLCLQGINKFETVKIDDELTQILIYHNGKMDSENPYSYNLKTKNVW
jgi:hypothetical protein